MKNKILLLSIGLLILVSLMLGACSPKVKCADGSSVASVEQCPEYILAMKAAQKAQDSLNDLTDQSAQAIDDAQKQVEDLQQTQETPQAQQAQETKQTPQTQETTDEKTEAKAEDSRVQAILEKHNSQPIKGYSFLYAPLPENIAKNDYKYYGDKVLVMPGAMNKFNADSRVDNIYLDLASKTARGFCMSNQLSICSVKGEERPVNFNDWFVKSPIDWLSQPGLEQATIKGDKQFQNFDVDILRFKYEGKYYEYLITKFWGVPLRIGIYSDPDYTNLIGGAEYRHMGINGVKASEVEPPVNQ